MGKASAQNQTELFDLELFLAPVATTVEQVSTPEVETEESTEVEPTMADMVSAEKLADIINGYSAAEFVDIMLATDTHATGFSRGVAVERVYIEKQAGKRARKVAAESARATRNAVNAAKRGGMMANKGTAAYEAMTGLMAGLTTRGVVMTLTDDLTVRVESLVWVKGDGDTLATVATFTVAGNGKLKFKVTGSRGSTHTVASAMAMLSELLPERSKDLMPRKFRDVMRTHRHKNTAPTDITGNRATRAVDGVEDVELTATDISDYAVALEKMATGPALRTSGKRSQQGVKLTAAEKRESDRARLSQWRAAKRAEKLAASMAEFIAPVAP